MKRKRFTKLLMGQFGYSRNKANAGAEAVRFLSYMLASHPDRPTYKIMYQILWWDKLFGKEEV